MVLTLIIDTSTSRGSVIIAQEGQLLGELPLSLEGRHSEKVDEGIMRLCHQLSLKLSDFKAIACGIGPGSFTGIRAGLALAQGLSFARNLPLITFSSLEGFISPYQGRFASVIDVRMGRIYLLPQKRLEDKITLLSLPLCLNADQFLLQVREIPYLITPLCTPLLKAVQIESAWIESSLEASHLASLCYNKYIDKKFYSNESVELLY